MIFVNSTRSRRAVAVVGIGCWYPGAKGPRELWENVLTRRREFRRIPDGRLPLADYHDPDPAAPDKTYGRRAAVIDGFTFDWAGMHIPRGTCDSTDVVQWLALTVAGQALAQAGYTREAVPRERTGVIVGNTLTGEHTRSNSLRLRWPFVRRALLAAAQAKGLPPRVQDELATMMEAYYKSVFPPVNEDTLAGGLSNTIPGRICNYFDLHGGGYTVDGACSSSLLAVCTAADRLASRQADLMLAGGVDISLDTFELVGFAKTGALTRDDMRVYDRRAGGFIPGEGCGFVVLKRLEDARAAGDTVYAVVRGWGVSSDGKGGLTAPSRAGQTLALQRAYEKAGYGPSQLDFVEGHGTGTKVGDKVELEAIAAAVEADNGRAPRLCGVTSFKSIMGHTKAAAGIGAFIKAVLAVNRRVLPPTAGCTQPNAVFESTARTLYPILHGEIKHPSRTLRAGVSAMGFGGINAHVTLESGDPPAAALAPTGDERALLAANQETELFVFGAQTPDELRARLPGLADAVELLSLGDLTDLAAQLARELPADAPVRAAVVAGTPEELPCRLRALADLLASSPPGRGERREGPDRTWWIGWDVRAQRLGFLLPGQGSQQLGMARVLVERYPWARDLVDRADRWLQEVGAEPVAAKIFRPLDRAADADERTAWAHELARTETAQPALCLASLLYARHLANLGLRPAALGGHSLGELTAFHLAGAFDEETLLKLAALRGQAMAAPAGQAGAMASLACPRADAEAFTRQAEGYVVVANVNSPKQTVVSGDTAAVNQVVEQAAAAGVTARLLPVSNAFHSDFVAGAAERLRTEAPVPAVLPATGPALFSSRTGDRVAPGLPLADHFAGQVTAPVDFVGLVRRLHECCDLLVEVGPGRVLSGLVTDIVAEGACLPVAGQPHTDRDLNTVLAVAFVGGIDVRWDALYEGRLVRPFVPASERVFIDNPCERPFAVPEGTIAATAETGGALEAALAEATGATSQDLQTYLARRQDFLVDVVKADLRSLNGSLVKLPLQKAEKEAAPEVVPAPAPSRPPAPASPPAAASLESVLVDLVAKRTGFPPESITSEARLLDDLNLDSIKAAELVAAAAREVGAAGKLDPSRLANATLAEVAAAIRAVAPAPPASPESVTVVPAAEVPVPSWVRDFAIEYVSA